MLKSAISDAQLLYFPCQKIAPRIFSKVCYNWNHFAVLLPKTFPAALEIISASFAERAAVRERGGYRALTRTSYFFANNKRRFFFYFFFNNSGVILHIQIRTQP